MATNPTYIKSIDWISRTILDGNYSILLPLVNKRADLNQFYRMNETATFLWNNLEKPISLNTLFKRVRAAFDLGTVSPDILQKEIKSVLKDWKEIGAIHLTRKKSKRKPK